MIMLIINIKNNFHKTLMAVYMQLAFKNVTLLGNIPNNISHSIFTDGMLLKIVLFYTCKKSNFYLSK